MESGICDDGRADHRCDCRQSNGGERRRKIYQTRHCADVLCHGVSVFVLVVSWIVGDDKGVMVYNANLFIR